MPTAPLLITSRLILRGWQPADHEPFAALNADPQVMEFMPAPLSREESDARVRRIEEHFTAHGFGLWALEDRATGEFLGFTGLALPGFTACFTPCVEVGWRLRRSAWGQGFATEAARAALEFGFDSLGLPEIVSFTTVTNQRSRRVMERLGLRCCPAEDFAHPMLPADHPLSRHVLYRLPRSGWSTGASFPPGPAVTGEAFS